MPDRRRTILCVDDNAVFVENLAEILEEQRGYSVVAAESCGEARALAERGFDVAIVDVVLPDGSGTELAQTLRSIRPEAQIILLTGFASIESAAAAVRAGAWAYLVKPCATDDLLLSIDQAVRHVRLLEDSRELQRRAQTTEKLAAIGTLTAGLSHEIKNPLNAAGLQLMVLDSRLDELPPDARARYREPLRLVQDEIGRLNDLLQEFLDFARPRDLALASFDLSNVLTDVLDLLSEEIAGAGLTLERAWLSPLTVRGDEQRLRRVVVNLVRNALQATPAGGRVRVSARAEAAVHLLVEDSGPGIPRELRARVFEPFFTTKASGSGLGLPLAHSIIEQHGGKLSILDSELGGAGFEITLPGDENAQLAPLVQIPRG
jgi:signal transduction histidine kinase